ncbi:hypothetical protein GGF32_002541 [Allomyces javanicus]|nr:hypothetical protein GGF32_002541 [Allomyces javanicus]
MGFRTTRATAVLAILVIATLLNVAAAADATQLETITMPAPPEDAGFDFSWETRKSKKNAKDVLVVGPVVTGVKGQGNGNGNAGAKKAVDTAEAAQAAAKKADPQTETITMPAPPADAGFEFSWETRKGKKNNKDVLVVGPVVTGVKSNNGNGNGGKKAVDAASEVAAAKKKDPQLETITMPAPPADAGFEFSWETRKGKKDQKDVLVVGPVVTGVKGQGNGKKSQDSVAAASSDAPAASGVSSGFIGIAVGAGVVLAAAVGAAVMVHRRRARKSYGSVEAAIAPTEVQPDRLVLNQH